MSDKKILTVVGGTGKQGGSVIDIVLSRSDLSSKYALRSITRDPTSDKAQALAAKGVELVKAELDDIDSLKAAFRGSYGVFGVTDFWSIMDKQREIQQGKNIVDAAAAEGVRHLVYSGLPYAEKLTKGELKHVKHFDSKAQVMEYAETAKGEMIVSYFMPAVYIENTKNSVKVMHGTPTLGLPYPSADVPYPLLDVRRDTGKYVMGLFEAGAAADGVKVHAVSMWSSPKEVVAGLSKASGKEVQFKAVPPPVFRNFLPEAVRDELLETMLLVGNYSYYGPGEEKNHAKHEKWLLEGTNLLSYEQWAEANGPYAF